MAMGQGSWVMWVMGQLCDGSHGSWVTKDDPFPSLLCLVGPTSPAILAQFTFEMYVAARNRQKITKTPYFGGSRSIKVIYVDVDIPKKLVTSACYDKQHVCA